MKKPASRRAFLSCHGRTAALPPPASLRRNGGRFGVALFHGGLATELDAAFVVHADAFDPNGIADFDDVLGPVYAEVGEFRDVAKSILAGQDFDEGTELLDGDDRALVQSRRR